MSTEPFHRQTFIAKLSVETFIGSVLPWLARFDQNCFQFFINCPLQQLFAYELRPIITSKIFRCATQAYQAAQNLDYPLGTDAAGYVNRQAFPRIFVYHRQAFKCLTIGASVVHEVVAPHTIPACWQAWPRLGSGHTTTFATGSPDHTVSNEKYWLRQHIKCSRGEHAMRIAAAEMSTKRWISG